MNAASSLNFMNLPPKILVFFTSMLPVSELRGAIPLGVGLGLDIPTVFIIAVAGNVVPVLPLLYLFSPLHQWAQKFFITRKFFGWLDQRTRRRAELVRRYELLGLMLLVAIPLPFTGAYTGCIAASIFGLDKRSSFFAIFLGVLIAGLLVSGLCWGIKNI